MKGRGWTAVVAAGAITVLTLIVLAIVCSWSAEAWTAIAAWVTAGIALAAGLIARNQLKEARRLRAEQAQPYVVVSMELSRPHGPAVDLVVKNLGKTAALNVRLTVDPTPVRAAGGEVTEIWLPDVLPVLVPEQKWSEFWDMPEPRHENKVPDRYTATVTYEDAQAQQYEFSYVLAWAPYFWRSSLVVRDVHDGVEKLGKIEAAIKNLTKAIAR